MSWRIDDHPEGGLMIEHLDAPRFTARWTTGDFPLDGVRDAAFFWTDEGSGEEDTIHFYDFAWIDPKPSQQALSALMGVAANVIEWEIFLGD